jgi:hypothetical protein
MVNGIYHSVVYGVAGLVPYTILILFVAGTTHGHAEASGSLSKDAMGLCIPLGLAVLGCYRGLERPGGTCSRAWVVVVSMLAGLLLVCFDLLVFVATAMAGYC